MNRPNILFFCTDQQRFDSLGCCGNQVAVTPNLDRIAAAGTRFTGHRTPCQICSPSRASMFTGRYPRNHGLVGNGIALDPAIPTLPAQLSAAGYRTHGVGKFHLQPILAPAELNLPESQAFWHTQQAASWQGPYYGFDTVELAIGGGPETTKAGHYARWLRDHHPEATELYGPESAIEPPPPDLAGCWKSAIPAEWHYNRWIADRASVYLQEVNDPFFLFVSFPDPHHPFAPPAPYCHQYDPQCLPAPRIVAGELQAMPPYYTEAAHPFEQGNLKRTDGLSEATLRQVIAHTYGTVSMLDDCVGRVMQTLEQRGLAGDTVVIFTSDHGELLGDHGLLHKGPPPYRQLLEVPLLVQGPGIPAGEECPTLTSHIDLMPTLLDLAGAAAVATDGHSLLPVLDGRSAAVREHLYSEYHPRAATDLYNQTVRSEQWRLTRYPEHPDWGELFDVEADPFEHHNRFADESLRPVRDRIIAAMDVEFPPAPSLDPPRLSKW